jgi:hypothetical protein
VIFNSSDNAADETISDVATIPALRCHIGLLRD